MLTEWAQLCNRASDNIMLLLGIWHEKYSLRYMPITLMQVIYCAGTSFILSAVQATSGPRLGRVALTTALSAHPASKRVPRPQEEVEPSRAARRRRGSVAGLVRLSASGTLLVADTNVAAALLREGEPAQGEGQGQGEGEEEVVEGAPVFRGSWTATVRDLNPGTLDDGAALKALHELVMALGACVE